MSLLRKSDLLEPTHSEMNFLPTEPGKRPGRGKRPGSNPMGRGGPGKRFGPHSGKKRVSKQRDSGANRRQPKDMESQFRQILGTYQTKTFKLTGAVKKKIIKDAITLKKRPRFQNLDNEAILWALVVIYLLSNIPTSSAAVLSQPIFIPGEIFNNETFIYALQTQNKGLLEESLETLSLEGLRQLKYIITQFFVVKFFGDLVLKVVNALIAKVAASATSALKKRTPRTPKAPTPAQVSKPTAPAASTIPTAPAASTTPAAPAASTTPAVASSGDVDEMAVPKSWYDSWIGGWENTVEPTKDAEILKNKLISVEDVANSAEPHEIRDFFRFLGHNGSQLESYTSPERLPSDINYKTDGYVSMQRTLKFRNKILSQIKTDARINLKEAQDIRRNPSMFANRLLDYYEYWTLSEQDLKTSLDDASKQQTQQLETVLGERKKQYPNSDNCDNCRMADLVIPRVIGLMLEHLKFHPQFRYYAFTQHLHVLNNNPPSESLNQEMKIIILNILDVIAPVEGRSSSMTMFYIDRNNKEQMEQIISEVLNSVLDKETMNDFLEPDSEFSLEAVNAASTNREVRHQLEKWKKDINDRVVGRSVAIYTENRESYVSQTSPNDPLGLFEQFKDLVELVTIHEIVSEDYMKDILQTEQQKNDMLKAINSLGTDKAMGLNEASRDGLKKWVEAQYNVVKEATSAAAAAVGMSTSGASGKSQVTTSSNPVSTVTDERGISIVQTREKANSFIVKLRETLITSTKRITTQAKKIFGTENFRHISKIGNDIKKVIHSIKSQDELYPPSINAPPEEKQAYLMQKNIITSGEMWCTHLVQRTGYFSIDVQQKLQQYRQLRLQVNYQQNLFQQQSLLRTFNDVSDLPDAPNLLNLFGIARWANLYNMAVYISLLSTGTGIVGLIEYNTGIIRTTLSGVKNWAVLPMWKLAKILTIGPNGTVTFIRFAIGSVVGGLTCCCKKQGGGAASKQRGRRNSRGRSSSSRGGRSGGGGGGGEQDRKSMCNWCSGCLRGSNNEQYTNKEIDDMDWQNLTGEADSIQLLSTRINRLKLLPTPISGSTGTRKEKIKQFQKNHPRVKTKP